MAENKDSVAHIFNEPLLNNREAAIFLNVSPATMRTWRFNKVGPTYYRTPIKRYDGTIRNYHCFYRTCDLIAFREATEIVTGRLLHAENSRKRPKGAKRILVSDVIPDRK